MMKDKNTPINCPNPLCRSTFKSIQGLLRHAKMSGRCSAYWDARRVSQVIPVPSTKFQGLKRRNGSHRASTTVLPAVAIDGNKAPTSRQTINMKNPAPFVVPDWDAFKNGEGTVWEGSEEDDIEHVGSGNGNIAVHPSLGTKPILNMPLSVAAENDVVLPVQCELPSEPAAFFTPGQKAIVKLMLILDDIGAPDYAVESILHWAEEAYDNGFNFKPSAYSREANLKWMYKSITNSTMLLPDIVQIELEKSSHGQTRHVDVVRYDFVPQILSLLQNRRMMRSKNLVVNKSGNPFSFYQHPTVRLSECHTGYAYQHLYAKHIQDPTKQFLCPIISYVDQTNVDKFSWFELEPLSFTLSIFNCKTRQHVDAWRLLGFVSDLSLMSQVE